MTQKQYYEEVFEEEYFEQEYYEDDDRRCTYEQRWWDYGYYQDTRFL